jgi:serine/threonine protein phosphatase PrpC
MVTLGMVADGFGEDAYGEEASHLAGQAVRRHFTQSDSPDVLRLLYNALREANRLLYERGLAHSEVGGSLGAALAAAVVVENKLYIANIGNCRIYAFRPGGELAQLTFDHTRSLPDDLPEHLDQFPHPAAVTLECYLGQAPEAALDFRLRLKAEQTDRQMLGNQGIELQPGDTLLLATAGVTNGLADEKIKRILTKNPPDRAAERLTRAAQARNAYKGASALVIQIPDGATVRPESRPLHPLLRYGGFALAGLLIIAGLVFGATRLAPLVGGATPEPTATLSPSPEPIEPDSLLPTIIPSNTFTPTETSTATATSTGTATPAYTPWPTWTPLPRPTWTPVLPPPPVPTATQPPTPEPTQPPTETPEPTQPPTDTPEPTQPPPTAT